MRARLVPTGLIFPHSAIGPRKARGTATNLAELDRHPGNIAAGAAPVHRPCAVHCWLPPPRAWWCLPLALGGNRRRAADDAIEEGRGCAAAAAEPRHRPRQRPCGVLSRQRHPAQDTAGRRRCRAQSSWARQRRSVAECCVVAAAAALPAPCLSCCCRRASSTLITASRALSLSLSRSHNGRPNWRSS